MSKKTYLFEIFNEEKTNVDTIPYMDYLSGGGSKWRAEYKEGRFIHSYEGKPEQSHEDSYLAYLEPGNRLWHMRIEDGKFVHTAASGEAEVRVSDECHFMGWDTKSYWARLKEADHNELDLMGMLRSTCI